MADERFTAPELVLQSFHSWRVSTINLMGTVFGDSPKTWSKYAHDYIKAEASHVFDLIRPWTDPNQQEEALMERLLYIFTLALELSHLIRCQRACWSLCYPPRRDRTLKDADPVTLDLAEMNDIESYQDEEAISEVSELQCLRRVDIFVIPALYKSGTIDGDLYEQGDTVVIKADILCSEM